MTNPRTNRGVPQKLDHLSELTREWEHLASQDVFDRVKFSILYHHLIGVLDELDSLIAQDIHERAAEAKTH